MTEEREKYAPLWARELLKQQEDVQSQLITVSERITAMNKSENKLGFLERIQQVQNRIYDFTDNDSGYAGIAYDATKLVWYLVHGTEHQKIRNLSSSLAKKLLLLCEQGKDSKE